MVQVLSHGLMIHLELVVLVASQYLYLVMILYLVMHNLDNLL